MAKAIPTQHFTHSLQALVFASQSPYSGLQTVFNNRNVKRNLGNCKKTA
jgi:hypothetical protein